MFDAKVSMESRQQPYLSRRLSIAKTKEIQEVTWMTRAFCTWTKPKGKVGSVIEFVRMCHIFRHDCIIFENVQVYLSRL